MKRALVIVLDSVGVGRATDAAAYGDKGADTLGHIFERNPGLELPALWSLGLGQVAGRDPCRAVRGSYGRLCEKSAGKDSMTGHWELMGVIVREPFALFESFPADLIGAIELECGVRFIGNCRASGTEIICRLGEEHARTGRLILYTSADSVLQIAAHEDVVPLERLYEICRIARGHADLWRIGRVIARPFKGTAPDFVRTGGRHDFSIQPPATVLNAISGAGLPVRAIGKTVDLFAGSGITHFHPTASNEEGMRRIDELWPDMREGLVFANLVDFDTQYGHRRDPEGYAAALARFDAWLGGFLGNIGADDLLIITADHGNDPTYRGTDHTREQVPLLVINGGRTLDLGTRATYADVAASLATFFELPERWPTGTSFVPAGMPIHHPRPIPAAFHPSPPT